SGMTDMDQIKGNEVLRKEAGFAAAKAINSHVAALTAEAKASEEGKVKAREFISSFLPVIAALDKAGKLETLKYKMNETGEEKAAYRKGGAEGYVKSRKVTKKGEAAGHTTEGVQMAAIKDLLAGRTGNVSGKTTNIPTAGAVHDDFEALDTVMGMLGVSLKQDAAAVEGLYDKLDMLKSKLKEQFSVDLAVKHQKPGNEAKRGYMSREDSGLALTHKELTATQFRTDISGPLQEASAALDVLAASGSDVASASEAIKRLSDIQSLEKAIPENVVMMNKKDYDNLVKSIQKEQGALGNKMSFKEASKMADQGLLHRFPSTGEQSFQARRVQVTEDDRLVPAGKIGVAGPAAGRPGDFQAMLAPLIAEQGAASDKILELGGAGEEADKLRARLAVLSPIIDKLSRQYLLAATNLDFDGDKISFFASTSKEAASQLRNFVNAAEEGGKGSPDKHVLARILGSQVNEVGDTQNLEGYVKELARVRKGPGAGGRGLAPSGRETEEFETQSLIGPKMSVGLLTDLFNKQNIAALFQAGEGVESLANAVSILMLNINKSLSMKGGKGGTGGPLELLEDMQLLRKDKIKAKLQGGSGNQSYDELNEISGKVQEFRKSQLTGMDPAELRSFQKKHGISDKQAGGAITDDMSPDRFREVIGKLIDFSSIESGFMSMIDKLEKQAMRAHAKKTGGTEKESKAEFLKMRSEYDAEKDPRKKRKLLRDSGFDTDAQLRDMAPGWLDTRKANVKRTEKQFWKEESGDPAGRSGDSPADRILQNAARKLAGDVAMLSEPLENTRENFAQLSGGTEMKDARQWASQISDGAKALKTQILGAAQVLSPEQYKGVKGAGPGTRGHYQPKSGEVFVSQKNI
ncbi:MAG: hypothetical protein DRQ89_15480, partial [Epsilonproteobacteria bacterium]